VGLQGEERLAAGPGSAHCPASTPPRRRPAEQLPGAGTARMPPPGAPPAATRGP